MKASIGRVLWFFPAGHSHEAQPAAAMICYVHSDTLVNVCWWNQNGDPMGGYTSVPLFEKAEDLPLTGAAALWMPYQVEQAAKAAVQAPSETKPGF